MRLEKYIQDNGIKMTWVARKLGVSYNYLNRLIKGNFEASPELAEKIYELTHGKVTKDEIASYKLVKIED